jgi:general secretion pathway protein K
MHGTRRTRPRERGFALVLVLWTMALLTLLATQVGLAGHSAALITRNVLIAARLQARAEAAVEVTLFRLLGGAPPAPDDPLLPPGTTVAVSEEAGKINPNVVSGELLEGLLLAAGYDPQLADRILDWRTSGRYPRRHGAKAAEYRAAGRAFGPPGTPIRALDELDLVLGLSPAAVDDLKADLTLVYRGDPVPRLARPRVLAALAITRRLAPAAPPPLRDRARAVCIVATARGADASEATQRACVRLDPAYPQQPWRVVEWTADAPAR